MFSQPGKLNYTNHKVLPD